MKYNPFIAIAAFVQAGLPKPETEYFFATGRKWRFDFAWVEQKIALEVEGGIFMARHGKKSRHFHITGALADMEKYNTAAALGWRVLRCTPQQLMTKPILELLKHAFKFRVAAVEQPVAPQIPLRPA